MDDTVVVFDKRVTDQSVHALIHTIPVDAKSLNMSVCTPSFLVYVAEQSMPSTLRTVL
jgi:hypothetical protein